MSNEQDTWDNVIRAACEAYKSSLYALSKESGVDQGQLRRFVAGEQSIGLATAEKLCRVLGITLQTPSKQRRK